VKEFFQVLKIGVVENQSPMSTHSGLFRRNGVGIRMLYSTCRCHSGAVSGFSLSVTLEDSDNLQRISGLLE
jgi:hypothetical protein